MKIFRAIAALYAAATLAPLAAHAAEEANYHIVQRIKVPDGGFDYATFDPATNRVYMPRGNYTTVIDTKTGVVSQFANGESNHIALHIPGNNLLVLTQGRL